MSMLTTIDNPFDPRVEFEQWYRWDTSAGYNTNSLLARIVASSHELSEADQDLAVEHAIDEIIKENVTGMYKKLPDLDA